MDVLKKGLTMPKTFFITGVSNGFGRALARRRWQQAIP
jgi:NAD(P)-dependent dehydrogenase (short-subunit alcohol dehydrogenase family)